MQNRYLSEAKEFEAAFPDFYDKKIILYGVGHKTASLLSANLPYNFVGLLDRNPESVGKVIFGLPILSLAQAAEYGDVIIINTVESYWETIWERIRDLTQLPVYYRNGQIALTKGISENSDLHYWDKSWSKLKQKCEDSDIITFDFYDTLVMRKVLYPSNVFDLWEQKTREMGYTHIIASTRTQVRTEAGEYATLADIYQTMSKQQNLTDEVARELMREELQIEKRVTVPRERMFTFCKELQESGKEIYIISDMYVSSEFICDLCHQFGLQIDKERIWVSCEKKASKRTGGIWEVFRKYQEHLYTEPQQENERLEKKPRILHIGDDAIGDMEMPMRYGLETYQVWSALEIAKHSSLFKIIAKAANAAEEYTAGLLVEKLCNDPFAFNRQRGKICFWTSQDYGYCVYGALIYTYLMWIIQMSEKLGKEKLFFMAREGFFLIKDYQFLIQKANLNGPQAVYLLTSRRIAINSSVQTEVDFEEILTFDFNQDFEAFMWNRFRIEIANTDPNRKVLIEPTMEMEVILDLLAPYKEQIERKLHSDRLNYLDYLMKVGVGEKKSAVVDFFYLGTIQYYLSKTIGKSVDGFYMVADLSPDNHYRKENSMYACFQAENDPKALSSQIKNKNLLTQSFLTAPMGMFLYFDENGVPCYDEPKKNQDFFSTKEKINQGVIEFMEEYINLTDRAGIVPKPIYIDDWYGVLTSGECGICEEVKNSFWNDNSMINDEDVKIYE
jgi:predicted HAD superfamily hydrolase